MMLTKLLKKQQNVAENHIWNPNFTDEFGEVRMSGIYTYGETVHMFIERKNYTGAFMPGYEKWESDYNLLMLGCYMLTIV
jgi:hypothetical protein